MIPCCGNCPDPKDKKEWRQYLIATSVFTALILIVVGLVILVKSF